MIPITEIKEGDLFANPIFVNMTPQGDIFYVEKINIPEKMICVQCYGGSTMKPIGKSFWEKNTDRMFSEEWRYDR